MQFARARGLSNFFARHRLTRGSSQSLLRFLTNLRRYGTSDRSGYRESAASRPI